MILHPQHDFSGSRYTVRVNRELTISWGSCVRYCYSPQRVLLSLIRCLPDLEIFVLLVQILCSSWTKFEILQLWRYPVRKGFPYVKYICKKSSDSLKVSRPMIISHPEYHELLPSHACTPTVCYSNVWYSSMNHIQFSGFDSKFSSDLLG